MPSASQIAGIKLISGLVRPVSQLLTAFPDTWTAEAKAMRPIPIFIR